MSTRSEIADALATAVPEARVVPFARSVDNLPVRQPLIMVYRETVVPSVIQGTRTEALTIWVAHNVSDPEKADDTLDPFLDRVLDVLEDNDPFASLNWSTAEREALGDAWPAYKITTTVQTQKE